MATRSSTSEYQPIPPNYALKAVAKAGNNSSRMSTITSSSTVGQAKAGNVGGGTSVRSFGVKTRF